MEHPDAMEMKSKTKLDIAGFGINMSSLTGKRSNGLGSFKEGVEDDDGFIMEDGMIYDETDWRDKSTKDDDSDDGDHTIVGKGISTLQKGVCFTWKSLNRLTRGYLLNSIFLLAYFGYFTVAMIHEQLDGEASIRLLACTVFGVVVKTRFYWMKPIRKVIESMDDSHRLMKGRKIVRWILYLGLLALMVWVLVDQGRKDIRNLLPVPGICVMLAVCLIFSTSPSQINWHTIYWSLGLQFICALFVLRLDFGQDMMNWIQDRFNQYLANTEQASTFLFGATYKDHYFVFGTIPMIIFGNATLSLLYYLGAIQFIINCIGTVLEFVLDTSPIESTGVAGGIFLEGGVALLSLLPYLGRLSQSQFFLLTTSLFSSLGGAYLGMLMQMNVKVVDIIPAMLMSAPATFTVAKIIVPEVLPSDRTARVDEQDNKKKDEDNNALSVVLQGAVQMLSVIGNVLAIIFSFYSFLSWINNTLEWFGDRVGVDDLSIEFIFSYLLYPIALCMGVEPDDCRRVASLLGYRIGSSNFIAFQELTKMNINKYKFNMYMQMTNFTGPYTQRRDDIIIGNTTLAMGFLTERSEKIITYALCGFSSIVTVGFHVAMLATFVPRRKKWLTDWFFIILIAGNLANCMTGAFSALFYYE